MRKINKWISLLLVLAMTLGMGINAGAASGDKPILALGADLSAEQRTTVLGSLGVSEAGLANYDVIYVTNEEEHQLSLIHICAAVQAL